MTGTASEPGVPGTASEACVPGTARECLLGPASEACVPGTSEKGLPGSVVARTKMWMICQCFFNLSLT